MNKDDLKKCAWENAPEIDDVDSNQIRMCKYCGDEMDYDNYCHNEQDQQNNCWNIDHIIPKSDGGKDQCDNVIAIHGECNRELIIPGDMAM